MQLLFALTWLFSAITIDVPRGPAPTIDGRMGADEWRGSVEVPLADGELRLRHGGEYLYVGLRLTDGGFPSLCVVSGDTVRILHASSALASAMYIREGTASRLGRPFGQFALRSAGNTPAEVEARRRYLESEKWVASNFAMSKIDHEMQISLALMPRSDIRIALGYYRERGDTSAGWPASLADGCTATKMVQGFIPSAASFATDDWVRLRLAGR